MSQLKLFFLLILSINVLSCGNKGDAYINHVPHDSVVDFEHYITRVDHQLFDGNLEFRFAGIHAPELHRIEDDVKGVCKADKRGWGQYFKWPTALEQENWIKALVRTGHKAMRIYVLSVQQEDDAACGRETHILKPLPGYDTPRLNETAMVVYDRMIALASEHKLRLILPFIDHWKWWGGREQLAAFYGEHEDDFYDTNSKTYQAYQSIIEQVITRKNTITGRYYYEEKAIMAWETGNELKSSTAEFVAKTAAHIKSLAPNQLVVDGTYLNLVPSSLDDPNVDIISNHFYTVNNNNKPQTIKDNLKYVNGKKAYLIGEFGLAPHEQLDEIMQTAVSYEHAGAKAVGAFIWGFRGHRETGGFYWHREGSGPHYSYHLPGFAEGAANQELQVVELVRKAQAQMAGLSAVPKLPVPEAPILHAINDKLELNWLGAPTGQYYRIERKAGDSGSWQVVADNLSDGKNKFNPATDALYRDMSVTQPGSYSYRVFAINESGESPSSNEQKVRVTSVQESEFVTIQDGQFIKDGHPYYFVGTNYWYGPLLGAPNGDRARLLKELDHLQENGVNNLRVLVGSDGGQGESVVKPALQTSPGVYDENLLIGLDYFLAELAKRGIVAVLYLNNNWIWSGGMSQYLNWAGYGETPNPFSEQHDWSEYMEYVAQFHSCGQCKLAYYQHVETIMSRTNSITGINYTEDPTIMSWQVANEPRVMFESNKQPFKQWLDETVSLMQNLAPHQLVSTGSEGAAGSLNSTDVFAENHASKDIDYLTMHVWPKNWSWYDLNNEAGTLQSSIDKTKQYMANHLEVAKFLNKPIVMSEFGFPREKESISPNSSVTYRNEFFKQIFSEVVTNKIRGGHLAGLNFWAYGGFGRASLDSKGIWQEGDDYLGDPAQEPQGLNTVFASDEGTFEIIRENNELLK